MIQLINNFFDENMLEKIQHHVKTQLMFTPQYYKDMKETYFGNRYDFKHDESLRNIFVKYGEEKFKLKIKNSTGGVDMKNIDRWLPHVDESKLNILVMIDGPVGINTGTVFYTDNDIDIKVGFRPNRAVLFPSSYKHCAHKSDNKNMRRYTATLFIHDYEELV